MLFSYDLFSFLPFFRAHRDLHSFPTRRSSDLRLLRPRDRCDLRRRRRRGGRESCAEGCGLPQLVSRPVRSPGKRQDRKSTRLNSSHLGISYAVFCLKKKKEIYLTLNLSSINL